MAERNEKKEKKKYAEPEMGYCPFEHKAGLGTGLGVQVGARDARSRRRRHGRPGRAGAQALGAWALGGTGARQAGAGRAAGRTAWACCWASGLCTRCTQSVFGPI